MTIKEIKEQYKNYRVTGSERNSFVTYNYGGETGKVVIIVNISRSMRDYVTQVVRVSDGKALLEEGRCRPCDNLDDAVDVAGEMIEGL